VALCDRSTGRPDAGRIGRSGRLVFASLDSALVHPAYNSVTDRTKWLTTAMLQPTSQPRVTRQISQRAVFEGLLHKGPISRAELSKATGLSKQTIS
jgi:hypothetical protein